MSDDPTRLFDSPFDDAGELPELRQALGQARRLGTNESERVRLAAALAPLLAVNAGAAVVATTSSTAAASAAGASAAGAAGSAGAGAAGASAATATVAGASIKTLAVWGLVASAVTGGGVAGVVYWPEAESNDQATVQVPAPQEPRAAVAPEPQEPEAEPVEPEVSEAEPAATEAPLAPAPQRTIKVTKPSKPAATSEPEPEPKTPPPDPLAPLEKARAVVKSQPSKALAIVAQHRKDFPRGPMVQEREVIAIEALVNSGQKAAAKARAERFKQHYKSSIHLRHIELLIGK